MIAFNLASFCVLSQLDMLRSAQSAYEVRYSMHKGSASTIQCCRGCHSLGTHNTRCAQVVTGEQARGRRVMVFCNTLDSCRAAEHSLREAGAATLCYHGDVPLDGRRDAIAAFTADAAQKPVLVATDLAARCEAFA